jgi:hypothetical protein
MVVADLRSSGIPVRGAADGGACHRPNGVSVAAVSCIVHRPRDAPGGTGWEGYPAEASTGVAANRGV